MNLLTDIFINPTIDTELNGIKTPFDHHKMLICIVN